jgi:hypothetical protein
MTFRRIAHRATCFTAALAVLPVAPAAATEIDPVIDIDPQSRHIGSHVRGATPQVNKLIARGIKGSRTFARLVEELNKSNVIVYLQVSRDVPVGLDGRLAFMTSVGPLRYLHAQVRDNLPTDLLLATAAHELQHALEVAQHEHVRDSDDLAVLYQRIGIPGHSHKRYDTAAARDTGRRVRQELS